MKITVRKSATLISIATLLMSTVLISSASAALDCSKAPDSKTPACVIANQNKNVAEEVDAAAALAQKAAALAARKAAEAKASKKPITLTNPLATVTQVPKPTPSNQNGLSPAPVASPTNTAPAIAQSAEPKISTPPIAIVNSAEPVTPTPKATKPAAKKASAIAKPKKSVKKKSTISCAKGSKVIKVTSTSPRCPSGYRRK
jgi:hypothetical protein